jgi:ATP-dependent protease ClpP protease subunit
MPKFNIKRKFYALASTDGENAEIQMYGDVVEKWPTDWWTGEKKEGSYIAQDEFLKDLAAVEGCKNVTIRLNSYGGDAVVGIVIHNRLREIAAKGTHLSCIVDGVAMSAGSVIMCACDTVKVNPSSLVMIHKGWSFLFGGYNADDLRKSAEAMDAYDTAMVSIYKRKSGMSDTVISHMMSDETYMTGKEAVEKGFADEVIEDFEPVQIAASANGRTLFVGGRAMHLFPGMTLPKNIPTVTPDAKASAAIEENQPVVTGGEKGGNSMTKEELRAQYPELVAEVEADARAVVDTNAAVTEAVQAEERRMQQIDEVSALFSDELVQEAKYGAKKCSAQELAYRAAQAAAKQGRSFLANLDKDSEESGAGSVGAAPGAGADGEGGEKDESSPEAIEAAAKAAVAAFMKKKEGK